MATYDIGDKLRIGVTFTDVAGTAGDPTTILLKVKPPNETIITYTYGTDAITRTGTGVYYLDYQVAKTGLHWYRWEGSGALTVVTEGSFDVRRKRVI